MEINRKRRLALMLLLLISFGNFTSYSQVFGPRKVIDEDGGIVRMVRTADFDGDSDLDVVIAANNNIAWYENLDGMGTFGEPITIQEGMQQSFGLFPADIDGDDSIDLVVAYFDEDILAWYKNLGDGAFENMQIISQGIEGTRFPSCFDLDGDEDLDIVLGLSNTQGLYWFENLDGDGSGWLEHLIDGSISQARTQAIGDIDGDNDPDILSNEVGASYLSWFPNLDGNGNFGNQIVIDNVGLYENSIYLADLDGDDDLDILSQKTNLIIWRENLDGMGNFSPYNEISDQAFNIYQVIAIDVDNDEDFDVVSVSADDNKVAWYENLDGAGNFGPQKIVDANLDAPRTVTAADLDGDGDLDLLSAALSPSNKQVVWYENLTILNVDSNIANKVSLVPNPVEDSFRVQSDYPVSNVRVMNASGMLLMEVKDNFEQIPIKNLQTGMYLVEVVIEHHKVVKKLVRIN